MIAEYARIAGVQATRDEIIALAPSSVQECLDLTIQAFNLSEKYRCPVFLASNKEIGMTKESVDLDTLQVPGTVNRRPPVIYRERHAMPHSNKRVPRSG